MSVSIQEGCVGLVLLIDLVNASGDPIDLTTCSEVVFFIHPPTGDFSQVTGYVYGTATNGTTGYTTSGSDFTFDGSWKYQSRVTLTGGIILYSEVQKIKVKKNIPEL